MSNLYDDSSQKVSSPETLPLDGIINQFIDNSLRGLRVFMPASIVAVHGDQTVDAQPLWQVKYAGQAPSTMPVCPRVPVMMPQGATYRISYPLLSGDTGGLLVADRSLDSWLASAGGIADPSDPRAHALADAVFVPGLVPSALQTTDTGTSLVLGNGALTMRLEKSGQFSVANKTAELVATLHDALQASIDTLSALASAQVLTPLGPSPFLASSILQFNQIQASLTQTLAKLDTFRS